MSLISKALGAWAIGKTFTNTTPLFVRLLLGVVAITALAVFVAILFAAITLGGLWFLHTEMVAHGTDPQIAFITLACAVLALIAIMVLFLQQYWRNVLSLTRSLVFLQKPISSHFSNLADSFVDGFFAGSRK